MKKPLSKALRTFYGVGDLGFSMMTSVELYLFVFFLTNVAKFSLPMVAFIVSLTSIVDAVLSPFYGAIIAGVKPMKWGRNRSWILIAPPFVVVTYMFMYTKIGSDTMAAAIICLGFIVSHILWNIAWVGNLSLITVLASTPEERGLLASRRAAYSSLAGVFFSYIASPMAIGLGIATGNVVLGYTLVAGLMAFLMMIGYWVIFKLTDGYESGIVPVEDTGKKTEKVPVSVMLKSLTQNPNLIMLLIADFFRYMSSFIMTAAAAYYFTYVAQNMALLPLYLLLTSIVGVFGAYIAAPVTKALSNRTTSIIGLFISAVILIIGKFVGLNLIPFFVVVLTARIVTGVLGSAIVALYSDASVYSEWKTGMNAAPFIMGIMNLSLKTAVISRGTIIPIVLAAVGFSAAADPATASDALKNGIIDVFLFIPGICMMVSAILLPLGYKLTKEKLAQYQKEIDERKKVLA